LTKGVSPAFCLGGTEIMYIAIKHLEKNLSLTKTGLYDNLTESG